MYLSFSCIHGAKIFGLISACLLGMGCQQSPMGGAIPVVQELKSRPVPAKQAVVKSKAAVISLADFEHLYPVVVLNPESRNVYGKYGIEFSGVCYACDLAVIKVTPQTIDFINVCDNMDVVRIKKHKYIIDENQLIVDTDMQAFRFIKVDEAPVYSLEILGKSPLFENKRIVTYYVPQAIIGKFEQHDCGDFEG